MPISERTSLASNRQPTDLPEATGCLGMRKATKWKIVSIGSGVGALATAGLTAYAAYAMITAGLCATGIGAVIGGGAVLFIALAILAVKARKEWKSSVLNEALNEALNKARDGDPVYSEVAKICTEDEVPMPFKSYYYENMDDMKVKYFNNLDDLSKVINAARSLSDYVRPPHNGHHYEMSEKLRYQDCLTPKRIKMLIKYPEIATEIVEQIINNKAGPDIDTALKYLDENLKNKADLEKYKKEVQKDQDNAVAIAIKACGNRDKRSFR